MRLICRFSRGLVQTLPECEKVADIIEGCDMPAIEDQEVLVRVRGNNLLTIVQEVSLVLSVLKQTQAFFLGRFARREHFDLRTLDAIWVPTPIT